MPIRIALPRWQLPSLVLVCLFLAACAGQSAQDAVIQPLQSPNDAREYRFVELDNGLRALLVSDPAADKAAASLDVYVGSGNNPRDRGGLAHFLEHMLFLGTDKYPDPADYEEYITEHGGHRNAYTAFEHTNYYFDVDQPYLPQALDRFAQFFVAPRFDAEYVDREINSVEAEYQMGLKTDPRRNLDVMREVVNPDHPFSILGVGTRETLADRPGSSIRDELLDFYRKYYSANLMTLAVLGRESLDELEALVEAKFSAVPNHNVIIPDVQEPLYREGQLPLQVNIQPEASERELQISFPLAEDYSARYRRKSLGYIGSLIGHEGQGSLLSLLKEEGWAEALGAGGGLSYRGGSAFYISITLTESGMEQREAVLGKVFEYLRLLREQGPQEWLYEEQAQVAALQFRFKEKTPPGGYVQTLANDMHYFSPRDSLRGQYLMDDFSPDEISRILQDELVAENALVMVVGKDVPVDKKSAFYFTPYSVQGLNAKEHGWLRLTDTPVDSRLYLPAPNPFIADDVELISLDEDNPDVPAVVLEQPGLKAWFRQDDEFRVPKGGIYTSFRSDLVNRSPRDAAVSMLYVALLNDAVNEYTYPAMLAGLHFSLYRHSRGIGVRVSGYNDKQLVLLRDMATRVAGMDADSPRFANIRADLVRGLENVRTTRPFRQVMAQSKRLLQHGEFDEEQLLAEMGRLQPADVAGFARAFWADASVEALVTGNYARATVDELVSALEPLLSGGGADAMAPLEVVRLRPGDDFVYRKSIEHDDSVFLLYVQAPGDSWDERALAALTGQVFKSGFYQQLRTEQQLGYVVSAFAYPVLDVPGLAMLVQSPSVSSVEVGAAVAEFLRQTGTPEGMSRDQFLRHRSALLSELRQPHKNLWEEADFFWREIARRQLGFDSRERLASAIESIDYEEWQQWYRASVVNRPAALRVIAPGRWEDVPAGSPLESAAALQSEREVYERP